MKRRIGLPQLVFALALTLAALNPTRADAHCDTLDGPVVNDAREALEEGDVTRVLKWVRPEEEAQIKHAFDQTLEVRSGGDAAKALADHYFFETLVRIHRAGEGAPYTGLKPAGTDIEPGVTKADEAIQSGSIEGLMLELEQALAQGVQARFEKVREAQRKAENSVTEGREYVAAYVDFIHYVEGVRQTLDGASPGHGDEAHAPAEHAHESAHTEPAPDATAPTGQHE